MSAGFVQEQAAKPSRRTFLRSGAAGVVGTVATGTLACSARAVNLSAPHTPSPPTPRAANLPAGSRALLKGGRGLSLDPRVGDFERADVLIEGSKIAAIQPNLTAATDVVDASNMIVMPGFVDTHRHMWLGPLRNLQPDGRLTDYGRDFNNTARNVYRPEDVYIGDLVSALGAINAGVTTILDFSNISNTPAHSDAAIQGLRESGIRGVYGYGYGVTGPGSEFPQEGKPRKWKGTLVDGDLVRISKLVEASRDYLFAKTGWPRNILRGGGGFVAG